MNKYKIKIQDCSLYVCYTLLFISYFIRDVNMSDALQASIGRSLRVIAFVILLLIYIIYILISFSLKLRIKDIVSEAIVIIFCLVLFYSTKDLYFSTIFLIVVSLRKESPYRIIQWSLILLSISTLIVLMLCAVGVLGNLDTVRSAKLNSSRYTLGFYHSNVLPLEFLYANVYYILLKKGKIRVGYVLLTLLLGTVIFKVCNSRNAFASLVTILLLALIFEHIKKTSILKKIFRISSAAIVPFLFCFTIIELIFLPTGGIFDKIENFFGRFRVGTFKARIIGIHVVNIMSNEDFFKDGLVIDNGYLYAILRYGLIMIPIIIVIAFLLRNKILTSPYMLMIMTVVACANLMDNDLFDYSILPFIIIAFNQYHSRKDLYYRDIYK